MKLEFKVLPKIGIGPIKIGDSRPDALEAMGVKPESFKKTPFCKHPTDSFYEAGFQIFYEGDEPQVESIELSRDCAFNVTLEGHNILELPVNEALSKIEALTGVKPVSDDGGFAYEIKNLGLWLWRPSNESGDYKSKYFATIGVGKIL